MKILGIDPGYERLGLAIVEKEKGSKEILLYSNCFKTSAKSDFQDRLFQIGKEVERIISEFKPKAVCIENLFLSSNQKTAMRVSEVRGAILYIAAKNNMGIKEYTPLQIKTAISGHGRSDKNSIIKMLHHLIKIPTKKTEDDEYDAIAAALTFFAYASDR